MVVAARIAAPTVTKAAAEVRSDVSARISALAVGHGGALILALALLWWRENGMRRVPMMRRRRQRRAAAANPA